jgi:hypothetical protein
LIWTRRRLLIAAGLLPLPVYGGSRAAAQEWRIESGGRVVRVYRPAGFHGESASLVLYVHGFFTDADQAWRAHRLPEQFAASGRNALFVVPAARPGPGQPLPWPRLPALLNVVAEATGEPLPRAVVAAGHSGAYKQIGSWLDHRGLRTILLLDGLYGMLSAFRAWVRRPGRRMALVSHDTAATTKEWTRRMSFAVRRDRCPPEFEQLSRRERAARVLAMGTDSDHFGIVTEGKALPLLLRWAGIAALP